MKKNLFILLLLGVSIAFAACSKSAASKEGDLSFLIWDTNQLAGMQANVDLFTKKYPNVKVNLQATPWNEYWQKLKTTASAGNMPDLFWMHTANFRYFAGGDALLDLTDRIKNSKEIDLNNYPADLVKLYQMNNKQYAIPKDYDTIALWYNKSLFDAAKVPYPTADWTWADLVKAAKALTNAKKGVYGILADNSGQEGYWNLIYQNGGEVLGADGKSAMNTPATIEAMKAWVSLTTVDKVSPPVAEQQAGIQLLLSGKVAMKFVGSWMVSTMKANDYALQNLDLVVLPQGKKRATIYNGLGYTIAAGTKSPNNAWNLETILASQEGNVLQATNSAAIPAFNGTSDKWASSFNSKFNLQVYPDMLKYAVIFPKEPLTADTVRDPIIAKMLAGSITVEAGMKEIDDGFNKLIADENK